jgi:hypothetical protein
VIPLISVSGKEHQSGPKTPRCGQGKSQFITNNSGEEFVRYGGQNSCAIATIGLRSNTCPMLHTFQHDISIFNNAVTGGAADMRNETHATAIMLKSRVIEPLGAGWSFAHQGFAPPINRPQISQGARTRLARYPSSDTHGSLGGSIDQQPYRKRMPSCSVNNQRNGRTSIATAKNRFKPFDFMVRADLADINLYLPLIGAISLA